MQVPRGSLPPLKCELQLILEGQGPEACQRVLESSVIGARFREHADICTRCGEIVRELYSNGNIPITDDPLPTHLLEFLQEKGE
jgi:hypothetical protein